MRVIFLTFMFFVFSNFGLVYGDVVWNFGRETRDSYVIGREVGQIHFFEKTKRIPLNIPPCHEVTAVRVAVDNDVSTPTVTYARDTLTVTVAYTLLQVSSSTFDVATKGRQIPGCTAHQQLSQPVFWDDY
ncbi:uncharacterized protein LOC135073116 [Ostrinia nubilalis]|uniref:uncharacterized protein LOC135073116 n=1 Tax=Ostrinia nubilalis TaxID=29057 RepID=UPI00308231FE